MGTAARSCATCEAGSIGCSRRVRNARYCRSAMVLPRTGFPMSRRAIFVRKPLQRFIPPHSIWSSCITVWVDLHPSPPHSHLRPACCEAVELWFSQEKIVSGPRQRKEPTPIIRVLEKAYGGIDTRWQKAVSATYGYLSRILPVRRRYIWSMHTG